MRYGIAVGLSCLLGCATTSRPVAHPKRQGPPVLFVHGFKGSVLENAQGDIDWVTGWQSLGLQTPDLSLPEVWDGTVQKHDGRHATQPLGTVRVIPWLWERDIYAPWLRGAEDMGYPFSTFAYDWRRDNAEAVAQLKHAMQQLQRTHNSPVRVVAHSMGGLVTLALLHEAPELFADVVFVGVPFQGGSGILPDLHLGATAGINSHILRPEVAATFTSLYCLFDTEGTGLVDVAGTALPMEWFSAAAWRAHRLGLFGHAPALADSELDAFEAYLQRALTQARAFRTRLLPKDMAYPPILAVQGRSRPTLVNVMRDGPKSVRGWDFETSPKELGDGRVGEHFSRPPAPVPYEAVFTDAEHADMLNDPHVIAALRTWFAARDAQRAKNAQR